MMYRYPCIFLCLGFPMQHPALGRSVVPDTNTRISTIRSEKHVLSNAMPRRETTTKYFQQRRNMFITRRDLRRTDTATRARRCSARMTDSKYNNSVTE